MRVTDTKEKDILREGGNILAGILKDVAALVAPGVTTAFLNAEAERFMKQSGATSSFLGYRPQWSEMPYPAVLCTSVNDEVVHAIPSEKRVLAKGDIVGIDCAIHYKGLCVDAAVTIGVGNISAQAQKLIDITRKSLEEGITAVRSGRRTGDIGYAVQTYVEKNGFSVVRDLAGHGVGKTMHEEPTIPNFGKKGTGELLEEGMVIAIEPMVCEGKWQVTLGKDGWTIRTKDGKLSAHFEHTVLVTKEGCEILTR